MLLDKAIDVLEDIIRLVEPSDPPEEHEAIKLGIEALQSIRDLRNHKTSKGVLFLPSETLEGDS